MIPQPSAVKAEKDQVREAFELWYSDEGTWPKAVEKDEEGRYALAGATAAWDAWKAGSGWQRAKDVSVCEDNAALEGVHIADLIRHPQAPNATEGGK